MFQQNSLSSIIGPDLSVDGDISIKGNLLIYGEVKGNIECGGILTMSKGSSVKGNVKTLSADISGVLEGDIEAKQKISLSSTSILTGNLSASILVIEDGSSFNGLCTMAKGKTVSTKIKTKKIASLNESSTK